MPGTCAASTSTGISCSRAAAAISRTGSTFAVGEVIWSMISSLVLPGRNAPRIRDDDLGVGSVQRQGDGPRAGAVPPALPPHGDRDGAVAMIGEQHLVARSQPHRLQHQRDRGGGVRHQRAAIRIGAEEVRRDAVGYGRCGRCSPGAAKNAIGLRSIFVAQPLLGALHADRDGAERAVVEIGGGRVEREEQPRSRDGRGRISGAHSPIVRGARASGAAVRPTAGLPAPAGCGCSGCQRGDRSGLVGCGGALGWRWLVRARAPCWCRAMRACPGAAV